VLRAKPTHASAFLVHVTAYWSESEFKTALSRSGFSGRGVVQENHDRWVR